MGFDYDKRNVTVVIFDSVIRKDIREWKDALSTYAIFTPYYKVKIEQCLLCHGENK
jgi:hypothetical protein